MIVRLFFGDCAQRVGVGEKRSIVGELLLQDAQARKEALIEPTGRTSARTLRWNNVWHLQTSCAKQLLIAVIFWRHS